MHVSNGQSDKKKIVTKRPVNEFRNDVIQFDRKQRVLRNCYIVGSAMNPELVQEIFKKHDKLSERIEGLRQAIQFPTIQVDKSDLEIRKLSYDRLPAIGFIVVGSTASIDHPLKAFDTISWLYPGILKIIILIARENEILKAFHMANNDVHLYHESADRIPLLWYLPNEHVVVAALPLNSGQKKEFRLEGADKFFLYLRDSISFNKILQLINEVKAKFTHVITTRGGTGSVFSLLILSYLKSRMSWMFEQNKPVITYYAEGLMHEHGRKTEDSTSPQVGLNILASDGIMLMDHVFNNIALVRTRKMDFDFARRIGAAPLLADILSNDVILMTDSQGLFHGNDVSEVYPVGNFYHRGKNMFVQKSKFSNGKTIEFLGASSFIRKITYITTDSLKRIATADLTDGNTLLEWEQIIREGILSALLARFPKSLIFNSDQFISKVFTHIGAVTIRVGVTMNTWSRMKADEKDRIQHRLLTAAHEVLHDLATGGEKNASNSDVSSKSSQLANKQINIVISCQPHVKDGNPKRVCVETTVMLSPLATLTSCGAEADINAWIEVESLDPEKARTQNVWERADATTRMQVIHKILIDVERHASESVKTLARYLRLIELFFSTRGFDS